MSYQDDQFNMPSFNKKKTALIVGGVVLIIVFILLSRSMFVTIKSGEAGVIFRPFSGGLDKELVYEQGFQWIAPWNDMIIYNIQKQEKEEKMNVLSSNGLEISIDVSIRFFLEKDKIGDLHNRIGTEYIHKIVLPEMRSATRKVIGSYKPEELYSLKRNEIRDKIKVILDEVLSENFIVLDALLIRSVKLPENLKAAIERKLEQEQQSQEYEFRIEKEQKEADRKKIEAQGIQDFQKIVTEGISDKLLKWKGIEATEKISESPNSKIIIMGNGSDGLPVILGGDK